MNGPIDLEGAADQGVDFTLASLFVEIDAIGGERVGTAFVVGLLALGLFLGAGHRARGFLTGHFGDAMGDEVDRVEARHVLFLQVEHGMAFAFGKQRDKHIGARHLGPPRGLHVDDGALDDALETGRRFGLVVFIANQVRQFQGDVVTQIAAQTLKIDAAGAQHGDGVLIFGQGEQQVF